MQRIEWRDGLWRLFCGAVLGLYLSAPAYAFTPSDSPLLNAAAVAPNVMLLLDDSGSMNSIIWAAGFDPAIARPPVTICLSNGTCLKGRELDMTDTSIALSSLNHGTCVKDGWYGFYKNSVSGLDSLCLKLPDPVGREDTRYSAKYLSYLISLANNSDRDFTDGSIPDDYRMNVARNVSKALVAGNRSLRIGLATFNLAVGNHKNDGGYITRSVSDLSAVSGTVTQAQADTNYNALIAGIDELSAEANTPLAEAYYEITRYFRGMAPYNNSTPTTYTSPIQYRCQRNYGVVITDGLPTYDRTFPADDPLGGSRLPNWDGISNNDGANLLGDDDGDTLYLDDIAKFAFDIDMRSTGTDAAGKSWDALDFPRQNMNTYTVGFTAANQMLADAATYGQGKYYLATEGVGLNSALSSALSDITSGAGSGGSGVTSGTTLTSGSSYFQTSYDPKDWRGTIKSYGFTSAGAVNTASVLWTTDTAIVPGATAPTYQSWNTLTNSAVTLAYASFSLPSKHPSTRVCPSASPAAIWWSGARAPTRSA